MIKEDANGTEQRFLRIERELKSLREENLALRSAAKRSRLIHLGFYGALVLLGFVCGSLFGPPSVDAQASPQVLTVKAPFTVVDDQGMRVMQIGAGAAPVLRGMSIYNSQGQLAVQTTVDAKGAGGVIARNPNIGGGGGNGLIYDTATNEPLIGGRGPDNKIRYEIGPKGIAFNNSSGNAALHLGPASDGAGRLTLANANGDTVFEAGTYPNGYGFARAYPIGGKMPIPVPWYIMGQPK
jgi:hypothetical protein